MPAASRLVLILAALAVAAAVPGPAVRAQQGRLPRRADPRVPLPNLRRLATEGVRADALTVVTPSVTWPNHTTLVTGVTPARHGVLANGAIEPSSGPRPLAINPRRTREELCRVPTLYDAVHSAGRVAAEINWPVTRESRALAFSMPDHPDPLRYTTPQLRQEMQEFGLFAEPTDASFSVLGGLAQDHLRTQLAGHLLRRHRPDLLLLHLLFTDSTQHQAGPDSDAARAALALADRHVGDVLQAVRESGGLATTAVFVVSDHGFERTVSEVRPNVRLRARGLIRPREGSTAAGDAALEWEAQSISEGGTALVYVPRGLVRPELVARTREALQGLDGVEAVLTPDEYAELGLPRPNRDPQAPAFLLTARPGWRFTNAVEGKEAGPAAVAGTHGYPHTFAAMDGLFVAGGAGLRRGVRLPRVRSLDVAPTLAVVLGVSLPNTEGAPIQAILQ
jgi:predicted AlkP superfamily pyrophosphatase or phosphodiesterase